jgi:hypothetical protein
MPCRADGSVRGVGILRLRSGRALRLREPLRLANRLAALRMTIRQRDPAGAEARWFSGALRGAEAPLFHGYAGGRGQGRGAKQSAEKLGSTDAAPEGATENAAFAVCLKAYPDTNHEFFNKLFRPRQWLRWILSCRGFELVTLRPGARAGSPETT